jgi:hypothetical protein
MRYRDRAVSWVSLLSGMGWAPCPERSSATQQSLDQIPCTTTTFTFMQPLERYRCTAPVGFEVTGEITLPGVDLRCGPMWREAR